MSPNSLSKMPVSFKNERTELKSKKRSIKTRKRKLAKNAELNVETTTRKKSKSILPAAKARSKRKSNLQSVTQTTSID